MKVAPSLKALVGGGFLGPFQGRYLRCTCPVFSVLGISWASASGRELLLTFRCNIVNLALLYSHHLVINDRKDVSISALGGTGLLDAALLL